MVLRMLTNDLSNYSGAQEGKTKAIGLLTLSAFLDVMEKALAYSVNMYVHARFFLKLKLEKDWNQWPHALRDTAPIDYTALIHEYQVDAVLFYNLCN